MHIGKRIIILRKEYGMKQSEISKGIISTTHLSNIEKGRYKPPEDVLQLIAKKLKVPSRYLVNYEEYKKEYEDILEKLLELVILNPIKAQNYINQIESEKFFPFQSLELELQYLLLKSCLDAKRENKTSSVINSQINILLHNEDIDELPLNIKRSYYYYKGIQLYFLNEFQESIYWFKNLLPSTNNIKIKAAIFYNLSLLHQKIERTQDSIQFAEQALEIYIQYHNWSKIGETYTLLGVLHWEKKDYSEAIAQLKKAKEIQGIIEDDVLHSRILHNLALVYQSMKDHEKAIEFFKQAIEKKKKIYKEPVNLMVSYRGVIKCYIDLDNKKLAKKYLDIAYENVQHKKDKYKLNTYYALLNKEEDSEIFVKLMKQSIKYFTEKKDIKNLKGLNEQLGEYFFQTKRYKLASYHFKEELNINKGVIFYEEKNSY
ncbi:helix-turn-helix transcriptional regulator [Salinibacillus xinjiangensis]|uniref:Tetratricopeptide repeat protein n=1 Tax=Salinibacillus xinjiangensis TaxID=1229268 RepID=A0A6G1XAV2_9BACI|nr:helix-turn-helix transcriptional regulator [Salinibacillus xinjiangensis]MRG87918.1 tetratricopeptide repeat protein [Salinibacillus xinjiangensis]